MSAVIPVLSDLLARHDLTRTNVLIYGTVLQHEERSDMGLDGLAKAAGVHRRTLINGLRKLREAGLIKRRHRLGRGVRARYVAVGPRG